MQHLDPCDDFRVVWNDWPDRPKINKFYQHVQKGTYDTMNKMDDELRKTVNDLDDFNHDAVDAINVPIKAINEFTGEIEMLNNITFKVLHRDLWGFLQMVSVGIYGTIDPEHKFIGPTGAATWGLLLILSFVLMPILVVLTKSVEWITALLGVLLFA